MTARVVCCRLCSSVLVLAEDPWSAAAPGLHLLRSVTPADHPEPERSPPDSGERLCRLRFSLSVHASKKLKTAQQEVRPL